MRWEQGGLFGREKHRICCLRLPLTCLVRPKSGERFASGHLFIVIVNNIIIIIPDIQISWASLIIISYYTKEYISAWRKPVSHIDIPISLWFRGRQHLTTSSLPFSISTLVDYLVENPFCLDCAYFGTQIKKFPTTFHPIFLSTMTTAWPSQEPTIFFALLLNCQMSISRALQL